MVVLVRSSWLVVSVLIAILPSYAAGLPSPPTPLGDAGTGTDAGNDAGSSMLLPPGAYEANLTPGDADWYRFAATGLGCVDITAVASTPMRFGVVSDGGGAGGVAAGGVYRTTIAAAGDVRFAVLPDEAPWSALSAGPYSFAVSRSDAWAVGDTRRDDAPSSIVAAQPIPDGCFAASFRHDGPDVDVWTFVAEPLDVVTYSLSVGPNAVGALEVLGPDGEILGSVGSEGVGQLVAGASGTYALRAASLSSTDNAEYVVALVVGPEPTGCRPYCLTT